MEALPCVHPIPAILGQKDLPQHAAVGGYRDPQRANPMFEKTWSSATSQQDQSVSETTVNNQSYIIRLNPKP